MVWTRWTGSHPRSDARVERRNGNLSLGHGFELAGMPAYACGELPLVDYQVSGEAEQRFELDPGKGDGDLALALAVWPHADRAKGQYLGVAGYLMAPPASTRPAAPSVPI